MSAERHPSTRGASASDFVAELETHRREIRAHCRRLIGSPETAEDLVQETFIRAWRARGTFEGRSTMRTWLYRIATNVCVDAMGRNRRSAWPIDTMALADGRVVEQATWSWSLPQGVPTASADTEPESVAVSKETVELTLLAAVKHLPERQRAVLVLRDAFGWTANETADAIGSSVAAANSALQRARATIRERAESDRHDWRAPATTQAELEAMTRYVDVLERYTSARSA